MTDDALERLRNKAKPKVESRDLSTVPPNTVVQNLATTPINSDNNKTSGNPDIEISTLSDIEKSPSSANIDEQSSVGLNFATKQTTIRLEKQILQEITVVCQESEISREVLIEAFFVYFVGNKSAQAKIIKEARKRDDRRKEIANQRRAKSMIERYG